MVLVGTEPLIGLPCSQSSSGTNSFCPAHSHTSETLAAEGLRLGGFAIHANLGNMGHHLAALQQ